jgi:hypothetical protein
VNEAVSASTTATVWVVVLEPEVFVTVKDTVFDPAVANA